MLPMDSPNGLLLWEEGMTSRKRKVRQRIAGYRVVCYRLHFVLFLAYHAFLIYNSATPTVKGLTLPAIILAYSCQ